MDEIIRNRFKQIFGVFGDKILEESIREGIVRFRVGRGDYFYDVTYIYEQPLCEIKFPMGFGNENNEKLNELFQNDEFLFEFQKLLTVPGLSYYINGEDNSVQGYSVFIRIFKNGMEIQISEISIAVQSVLAYGMLAYSFIRLSLGKNQNGKQLVEGTQNSFENPMFR